MLGEMAMATSSLTLKQRFLSAAEGIFRDRAVSLDGLCAVSNVQVGDSGRVSHRFYVPWFRDHQCAGDPKPKN